MTTKKHILLGISGGIAAYKSCELVRLLKKQGHEVSVAMSRAATEFVSPLTFQALSGHPVLADTHSGESGGNGMAHINLTRTALLNADPALRKDLLLDLATLEGIRIYPAEAQDKTTPMDDTPALRTVTREVRLQLGADTRFAASWEGLSGFWVSFRIGADDPADTEDFWVMLPIERVMRPHAREWLWWGLAALSLAMLGAYAIVSRLNRPLRAMVMAARTVGRGEVPPQLSESGPAEVADLAHAFNQMAHDLQQLDADRALILAGLAATMAAIFALDTLTEYAVAAAVFHTAVILVAVRWFSPRLVIGVTALCIALTLASFALTPAGAYRTGLINTGISILAIVITAYLGLKMVAAQNAAHAARTQLLRITQATSLGQVTASIAHEVNQPLAAVITNSAAALRWLALEQPNHDEVEAALRRVSRARNRLGLPARWYSSRPVLTGSKATPWPASMSVLKKSTSDW
mgnify:CR=1 FL=1